MAASLPFERIKHILPKYKSIVFGYIREYECTLPASTNASKIPELVTHAILLFFYHQIESKILDNAECDTLLNLFALQHKLDNLAAYSYKLIYATYRDGIGEKLFKQHCHDQPHLLCIVHSKDNNVFGGYTSTGWTSSTDSSANRFSSGRKDDKSFVFSIRSNKGYPPAIFNVTTPENSLWVQGGYYMMFAGSCVIYIASSGKSGYAAKQPQRYEQYPHDSYLANTNFGVSDIEVFQLAKI